MQQLCCLSPMTFAHVCVSTYTSSGSELLLYLHRHAKEMVWPWPTNSNHKRKAAVGWSSSTGYVSSETYFISQTQLSKSCYGTVVPRFQVTSPYLKQILPGGFVW